VTLPVSLVERIAQATAGCDTEADGLSAVLGLEGSLDEDERAYVEHLGLLVLAAIQDDRGGATRAKR
jgi:hypothetical protein